jgi:hypothetical protein
MKVVLLLSAFTILITQKTVSQNEWSGWQDVNCYDIQYQYRIFKKESTGKYEVQVLFKNNYNKKVHFGFNIVSSNEKEETIRSNKTEGRSSANPNSKEALIYPHWEILNSDDFYVHVSKVRLGKDVGPYMGCGDASTECEALENILAESRNQKIKEMAGDAAFKQALKLILSKASGSIFSIINPNSLGTYKEAYINSLDKIDEMVSDYSRPVDYIELKKEVDNLKIHSKGIRIEKEFNNEACYDALEDLTNEIEMLLKEFE